MFKCLTGSVYQYYISHPALWKNKMNTCFYCFIYLKKTIVLAICVVMTGRMIPHFCSFDDKEKLLLWCYDKKGGKKLQHEHAFITHIWGQEFVLKNNQMKLPPKQNEETAVEYHKLSFALPPNTIQCTSNNHTSSTYSSYSDLMSEKKNCMFLNWFNLHFWTFQNISTCTFVSPLNHHQNFCSRIS